MVKRLFTFGCSYTEYYWPTWATFFGSLYDEFYNWGQRGGGNQFIFESLIECHATHQFNRNDTIVIMWSTYQRFDTYTQEWNLCGNIFNSPYSEEWIEKYWSIEGGILHSLNYISAAQIVLNSLKVKWAMPTMTDLSDPFGEKYSKLNRFKKILDQTGLNLFREYPKMKKYKDIFNNENMIMPALTDFCKNYNNDSFNDSHFSSGIDNHPTPLMHLDWAQQILAPHFNIVLNATDILTDWQKICPSRNIDYDISDNYTRSLSTPVIRI